MSQKYCYQYPHPAVTTDVVVFTLRDERLQLLLVKRGGEPFKGSWALPGGFLDIDEDLESCAKRELQEETGVSGVYLEQLFTFGKPDRDPRERVISVAYYALIPSDRLELKASSDAADADWFPLDELPELAFDHNQVIRIAHERLVSKLSYSTIAFQFMPEAFTLSELQSVYEILRNEPLDKRNFRKWISTLDQVEETGEQRRTGQHRPAKVYRMKHPNRVEIIR
ncbi:NUDIX hydrolase [Solemya velesiana gill symbiont]|uniref:NUDIX hydrolase n=1 Tax=Solemya velesiana gill symbiont TaxID=1918948 RepID=A0A1T2KVK7_9GAMM|nr:NUDIX domain-containing protein [Solemya velesiana gill symbiont]OOZ36875.1 NUDIX hydrolase [Solemya velesiana gill symbiont]